jgi:hypothetical protein
MIRPIALALIALAGTPATAAEAVTAKVLSLSCYEGDTCQLEREILPGRDRVRLQEVSSGPESQVFK